MVIDEITFKGDGVINEDVYNYQSGTYWVMDGVSPITSKLFLSKISDSNYLVNKLSNEMVKLLKQNKIDSIKLLKTATNNVRKNIDPNVLKILKDNKFQPSFAIAIIQFISDIITINILSDCYVIFKTKDKYKVLTDRRINVIANKTQTLKKDIAKFQIEETKARTMIYNQLCENRSRMNIDYWVGTLDGKAFDNMYQYILKKEDVDQILICSDGFYRIFDYNLINFETIFNSNEKLEKYYHMLKNYEISNSTEIKRHDDVTAIKIKLKEN